MTTPAIRCFKRAYPDAEVDFAVRSEYAELLEHNPHIRRVIRWNYAEGRKDMKRIRTEIAAAGYDSIIDLHNNARTRFLRRGRSASVHIYRKKTIEWMALVAFKKNLYKMNMSVAERYLAAVADMGIEADAEGPELFVPIATQSRMDDVLQQIGFSDSSIIALCPGSRHYTKRWPLEYFDALCRQLLEDSAQCIAVLGDGSDADAGKHLAAIAPHRVHSFCGTLSLLETAAVMRRCKAAVTNDSGLMHMATAVKTPVTAVFGSTVKEFGFFPYNSASVVLEVHGLPCRPCTHIGRASCPKGHLRCLTETTPDAVREALRSLRDR